MSEKKSYHIDCVVTSLKGIGKPHHALSLLPSLLKKPHIALAQHNRFFFSFFRQKEYGTRDGQRVVSANMEGDDIPYKSLKETLQVSRKRSHAMFLATQRLVSPDFSEGAKIRVSSKVLSDYRGAVRPRIPPMVNALQLDGLKGIDGPKMLTGGVAPLLLMDGRGTSAVGETPPSSTSQSTQGLTSLAQPNSQSDSMYNDIRGAVESVASALSQRAAPVGVAHGESSDEFRRVQEIAALAQSQSRTVALRRAPPKVPRPAWHPPWKLFRVISGSLGWVRSLAIEPGNQWFASGAGDRTIKIWDLASGKLKLTLTGHIETVRGLCISPRNPYMYSVGEDKMVKCWDLETNKVGVRT